MIDLVVVRFLRPDRLGCRLLSSQYTPFKPERRVIDFRFCLGEVDLRFEPVLANSLSC